MNIHVLKRTILFFCLLGALCQSRAASPPFNRIVQPAGWPIPIHGSIINSGIFKLSDQFPDGVTFSEFDFNPEKPILLPWYFISGSDLVLLDLPFQIVRLRRVEVNGRPVAYVAGVKGLEAGVAGEAWWMDENDSGKFTIFQFGIAIPELADWLRGKGGRFPLAR